MEDKRIVKCEYAVTEYTDGSYDFNGLDKVMIKFIEANPVPWYRVPVYIGVCLKSLGPVVFGKKRVFKHGSGGPIV